jgi:hypothetical protein
LAARPAPQQRSRQRAALDGDRLAEHGAGIGPDQQRPRDRDREPDHRRREQHRRVALDAAAGHIDDPQDVERADRDAHHHVQHERLARGRRGAGPQQDAAGMQRDDRKDRIGRPLGCGGQQAW